MFLTYRLVMLAWMMLVVASEARAIEFKNMGGTATIMYDAPTTRGQKLYVAPRGMPVEVIINYGAWSKVRDFAGDLSWIETKQLSDRKSILVRSLNAKIHANPSETSPVVFSADKGVLLTLVESTTPGWVKVSHADGSTGYILLSDVWGV